MAEMQTAPHAPILMSEPKATALRDDGGATLIAVSLNSNICTLTKARIYAGSLVEKPDRIRAANEQPTRPGYISNTGLSFYRSTTTLGKTGTINDRTLDSSVSALLKCASNIDVVNCNYSKNARAADKTARTECTSL